jgi:C1A family cysteine protease
MQPVQEQGSCGSCWAFATMRQLEAMMKIRNPNFNSVFGAQYLVDCDTTNAGCNGGWPNLAMGKS